MENLTIINTFPFPKEVLEALDRYKCKLHTQSKVHKHFFPDAIPEKLGYTCPICKEDV
ncbi:hypothetical protein UFOVP844_44 [uncultured Caudovirales phage]|uniref:Uncharacterized protein n=1 Tax=uncultured Caudovirales phage TaxID=2100421 RepID=A0A6J5P9P8_9CAUD|nr:hypothetical protein UFOVP844_44 [uncultured Caudovirales phage]